MKLVADKLIMQALEEDITSEDISTNAVMQKEQMGEVDLICKEDGVIAGLGFLSGCLPCWILMSRFRSLVKDGER